jgi:hypothetical protein
MWRSGEFAQVLYARAVPITQGRLAAAHLIGANSMVSLMMRVCSFAL